MNNNEIYLAILVMVIVNYFTRALPFLFFRKKKLPKFLVYIERFFPPVIMTILVFYTLKDVNFVEYPYALKEVGAILFTGVLHVVFKNYLVSIFAGTIFYMFLLQYI
ncbi:MAG: AzlD domain-containing protein [Campylobacterales bacterium]|nr:AzlD domain-containing protein [Campylobacterales bacterium]NQY52869.1 AzlD domain-containing protein [Campylobacteraceae bacterium]